MASTDPGTVHLLPLSMAMFAGLLYALAANGVSYMAEYSKKTGTVFTQSKQYMIDGSAFMTYVVGGLISTAAYASGDPVPLLQGTLVATNLLLNMFFQIWLGISHYTKSMRIGTILCFVVVIFQLAYVGPTPRPDDADIVKLFSEFPAIVLFIAEGAVMVLSTIGVYATASHSSDSFVKILSWAMLLGALGSGTDNAASTFGVISGWVLYAAFFAYGLISIVVLGLSAKAPAVCDANTYVPLQLSLQLCLNMVTGVFVWKDLGRMEGRPLQPYFVTFVIIILSVYVASPNADLVESMLRWRVFRTTKLSEEIATTSFGRAIIALVTSWANVLTQPGKESEDAAKEALTHALLVGSEHGRLSQQDMVDLAVHLHGANGTFALSAKFLKWMENVPYCRDYLTHDPGFREKLLSVLPASERDQLPSTFMKFGAAAREGEQFELGLSWDRKKESLV